MVLLRRTSSVRTIHLAPFRVQPGQVRGEETVWFNQAEQWHPSSLDGETRQELVDICGPDNLPVDVRFGDGSTIPDQDIETIKSVLADCSRSFPWHADDVLVIDNMIVAHGRTPYVGQRRILVCLT